MAQVELELREQILKKISHELHDNIGQLLTVVKLHLTSIQVNNHLEQNARVEKSIHLVSRAIDRMRNLSKTMDVDNLAASGLVSAVAFELDVISETGLITAKLYIHGNETNLDPYVQTIVYRIIQEALNNSIKHAEPSRLVVEITYSIRLLSIAVSDNGKGFNTAPINFKTNYAPGGSGLNNMKMRAMLIGAKMVIISTPGAGTTVQLSVPTDCTCKSATGPR